MRKGLDLIAMRRIRQLLLMGTAILSVLLLHDTDRLRWAIAHEHAHAQYDFDDYDDGSVYVDVTEADRHRVERLPTEDSEEAFENPAILQSTGDPNTGPTAGRRANITGTGLLNRTVWSLDFNLGPVQALRSTLEPLGVRFIVRSLSPSCHLTHSCAPQFNMLRRDRWTFQGEEVVEVLAKDKSFLSADYVLCIRPLYICEFYLRFNKSMILVIDGRYEFGHTEKQSWLDWNRRIANISKIPGNIIVATSSYDAEYVRFFTGLDVTVMSYSCEYVTDSYNATRESFLLMPVKRRGFEGKFLSKFWNGTGGASVNLTYLPDTYRRFSVKNLASHKGLVYVPHQMGYLALTEHYRLGVPMFLPSIELLARWHYDQRVITDKSLIRSGVRNRDENSGSEIAGVESLPDPNDNTKLWAIGFWLIYADFYQMPHLYYYNTFDELRSQLANLTVTDLRQTSEKMQRFNAKEFNRIRTWWYTRLKSTDDSKRNLS